MKTIQLFLCLTIFSLSFLNVQGQKLRIMSYNIHHGADRAENNTVDSMGYFIKETRPDIVGLQEVDSVCDRSGRQDQMKRLAEITDMHYAFVRHFPYQEGAYGLGILSKYPILNVEKRRLKLLKKGPNGNSISMLLATVHLPGGKNILFTTVHYSASDKETRLSQVRETIQYLSENSLQVIFTGDLNATPEVEEMQLLQQYLQPTDISGIFTFPETNPIKKIDYILISPEALHRVKKISAPHVHYSDHLPLIADIILK